MNVFQAIKGAIEPLLDNQHKEPMTVSEVSNLWIYLALLTEANVFEQMAMNTTSDDELKRVLEDANQLCFGQIEKIKNVFIQEGVLIPPTSEDRPKSDPNYVPIGVKATDDEIANALGLKVAGATSSCAIGMTQSIRNDISALWLSLFVELAEFGAILKGVMRKRGWLKIPPIYVSPGTPK